jgi:hypothetical protein
MQIDEEKRPQTVADFLALLDAPSVDVPEVTVIDKPAEHEDDTEKNDKTDNNGSAPKVADNKPVIAEPERKKNKSWLWILIALIGVCVGLSALFIGGETEGPSSVVVSDSDSVQVDAVDEETVPRTVTAVDLGLSVKWADRNVGADSPEDYGDYFAWGETEPKSTYDWSTYKWCEGDYDQLTKYCTKSSYGSNGFTDGKTTLSSSDDAATANMGSSWRMPTKSELEELKNGCTWTWTTRSGKEGYKVTGPSGKSIFLPAAGYRSYGDLSYAGSYGGYWSSLLDEDDPEFAWGLSFDSGNHNKSRNRSSNGRSVRAVVR